MSASTEIHVRVIEAEKVAEGIKRLKLVAANGERSAGLLGGAHTVVVMQDGDRQRRNRLFADEHARRYGRAMRSACCAQRIRAAARLSSMTA